ncbi:hypothetical protein [Altericroceibacterium endophyticum]|uniref:Uncharacterized protein n=1 Tax=Altericroceibacterium endophyticum TaxID=1808508 RepID=A0A6I4T115_9SPHN|nr:hypothetical protein [Altericroceibacterium endophyticum]MXO64854.1 hypothetical protein [Altericroceibacterium endophyticum]
MLDYSLHSLWLDGAGNGAPAPALPAIGGQQSLPANTASDVIASKGNAVLFLYPTEKMRVDLRAERSFADPDNPVELDPTSAFLVLEPYQPRPFTLAPGSYRLSWAAWSE